MVLAGADQNPYTGDILGQAVVFCVFFRLCGLRDFSYQPGIEPTPPAVKLDSPNHWSAREVWTVNSLIFGAQPK